MGLYHSVGIAYGTEIPNDTSPEAIDRACFGQPDSPDSVGYLIVGDYDRLLLITRMTPVKENEVATIAVATLAQPGETAAWDEALDGVAGRLGCTGHPQPGWLVIHNHR